MRKKENAAPQEGGHWEGLETDSFREDDLPFPEENPDSCLADLTTGAWEGLGWEEPESELDAFEAWADFPSEGAAERPSASEPFDVRSAPLLGTTLLEASAGTGKTFSIKHLVLRLVAEAGMRIDELLVVSFTNAATAELSMRIRRHLAEASAYLSGERPEASVDGLIREQVERWRTEDRDLEAIADRLKAGLMGFDGASIFTIHSFCQKMLRNHAFTASGAMTEETTDDDAGVFADVVEDWLRRALDRLPEKEAREELLQSLRSDPDTFVRILKTLEGTPEDLVRREAVTEGLRPDVAEVFRAFVAEEPARVTEEKRRRGVLTFDDMLSGMWRLLAHDRDGHFAEGIRAAYRGVLIDEFQDTDPVQFAIFDRLFFTGLSVEERRRRALFFVGDPKQAIYRFRSADLNTYMRARRLVGEAPDGRMPYLERNFRSSDALVSALNAFYGAGEEGTPFLRQGLDYTPVKASGRRAGLWLKKDGVWTPAKPFEVWGTEHPFENADEREEATVEATAEDIALWVGRGRAGEAYLPWNPDKDDAALCVETLEADGKRFPMRRLEARDIAILCRSRNETVGIQRALRRRGIRVRVSSQDTVCRTNEAAELMVLLRAMASPSDERLMKAVRVTRLFGETVSGLAADDEARRIAVRARLETARELWLKRGVAPAIESVLSGERVTERLLPVPEGERMLVNYAHLTELLHEAGRRYKTPAGLIAHFAAKLADATVRDEEKIRLESDANLVTIETIHSSKGLEYPIVYWPQARKGANDKVREAVYRSTGEKGESAVVRATLDLRKEPEDLAIEQREELTRLGYVALTRASARLVVGVPATRTSSKSPDGWHANSRRNPFFWSLCRSLDPSKEEVLETLRRLDAFGRGEKGIVWREIASVVSDARLRRSRLPEEERADDAGLSAASSSDVPAAWRTASFTGLTRMLSDDAPAEGFSARRTLPLSGDPVAFPKGPRAGDALHQMLETADFSRMAEDSPEAETLRRVHADAVLARTLELTPDERALASEGASAMIRNVLTAELAPGVRLADVAPSERTAEMGFLLSMPSNLTAADLGSALAAVDPKYAVPGLTDRELTGYLTGYIDLAFGAGGKFWILDWKSNALADTREGFTQEVMAEGMRSHHYRLQYLLYAVAMRRYLKARLGSEYSDDLLGGALYVFLRGVSAGEPLDADGRRTGVVLDRIAPEVIAMMDELFETGRNDALVRRTAEAVAARREGAELK